MTWDSLVRIGFVRTTWIEYIQLNSTNFTGSGVPYLKSNKTLIYRHNVFIYLFIYFILAFVAVYQYSNFLLII